VNPKLNLLQDVISLMNEAQINEILFEQAGVKIHLRKGYGPPLEVSLGAAPPASVRPAAAQAPSTAFLGSPTPADGTPPINDGTLTVTSPMVGTFYRASAPDAKSFIQEGAHMDVGQVFCIIEAMKLMNEIKSEVSGKIVKVLVANGQAVEFGQPLLVVDPS
jgi:oxaloacetate decarboxylase alpha subunit